MNIHQVFFSHLNPEIISSFKSHFFNALASEDTSEMKQKPGFCCPSISDFYTFRNNNDRFHITDRSKKRTILRYGQDIVFYGSLILDNIFISMSAGKKEANATRT